MKTLISVSIDDKLKLLDKMEVSIEVYQIIDGYRQLFDNEQVPSE